jgi:adenylate cyclase
MVLKLRTILILLMATTVVSLGTGLSIWSLWASTSAARNAAISSASQQAVSGVIAVEHVLGERESLISSVATMIGQGASEQEAFAIFGKFWKNFRKNFVNHGAFKYSKLSGAGVIDHRESPEEIVTRQIDGSFLALDVRTGKTRIVPDMRQEPWFQAARESKEVGYLEMRPTLCPFDGKWRRCITIHTPVIDRNGKFIGAIGLELTMDWYRQFLMEAMDRSAFPTRSFGVEKKADGTLNLIADTEEETDKLDMFAEGQSEGFVDALTHGAGIFADAVRAMPNSQVDFESRKPIHKRISSGNRNYLATYMVPFPGRPPNWMICFLMDEADLYRESRHNLLRNMAAVAIGLALAIGASMWISVHAVKPIERVTALAGKLERLEVEETDHGKASAIREVDDLRRAIGRAAVGLKSFLKYVPQELLKGYMSSGEHARTDGMLREVSIAFIDIRDYSTVSERLEPMELVTHLNAFLEEVCPPIISRSGTIDKFIGDSVMAFWNAPGKIDGHPAKACEAMLDCLARVSSAAKAWKAAGLPAWEPCVGIHTGEVIVGNIGSSSRLNYTIIGDAVNLTSRLESLNRIYGTSILITEATRDKAGKRFITRPVDLVAVKGKSVPVLVHELMGEREVCRETLRELADSTAKAHAKLANREYTRARLAYQAIMAAHPADTLSRVMAERCAKLEMDPPPADWSGVFRYNTK